MGKKVTYNGKTFTFSDNTTDEQIATALKGYNEGLATDVKKKVDISPSSSIAEKETAKPTLASQSSGAWTDVENAFRSAKQIKDLQAQETQDKYDLPAVSDEIFDTYKKSTLIPQQVKDRIGDVNAKAIIDKRLGTDGVIRIDNPAPITEDVLFNFSKKDRDEKLKTLTEFELNDIDNTGKVFGGGEYAQSKTGKVAHLVSQVKSGKNLTQEDVNYLSSSAPAIWNELKRNASITEAVDEEHPLEAISRHYDKVNTAQKAIKSINDANGAINFTQSIGFDNSKYNDTAYIDSFVGNVSNSYKKKIDELEKKYPVSYNASSTGSMGSYAGSTYRDPKFYKEKEAIDNEANGVKNVIAKAVTSLYARNNKLQSPELVGEKIFSIADKDRYELYLQSGKTDEKYKSKIVQAGIDALYGTGDENTIALAKKDEADFNTRFPSIRDEEIGHRLSAELYKKKGYQVLATPPSVAELDAIVKTQFPSDLQDSYYRSFRKKELERSFGTNVPLTGALNELGMGAYQAVKSAGVSLENVVTDYASPMGAIVNRQRQAGEILAGQPIGEQSVGDWQQGKQRLAELNGKPKLTYDEIQEKKNLEGTVDILPMWAKGANVIMSTTGQVLPFSALGIVSGGLAATAEGAKIASQIGMSSFGFLQGYDEAQKTALELNPNMSANELRVIGSIMGAANAGTEMIFNDAKVLNALRQETKPLYEKLYKVLSNESIANLTESQFRTKMQNFVKNDVKAWAKNTAKSIGEETAEESLTQVVQSAVDAYTAPQKWDANEEASKLLSTIGQTALGSVLVGGMAGVTDTRANRITVPVVNQIGYDSELRNNVKELVKAQQKFGNITEQEANDKLAIINTLENIHSTTIPDANKLRPLFKNEIEKVTMLTLQERINKEKIKNGSDFKELLTEQNKAIEKERNKIIGKEVVVDENYNTVTVEDWNNNQTQIKNAQANKTTDTEVPTNVKPEGVQEQPNAVDSADTKTENDKLVDAKIESAVIEIGGKQYEGKNHAEAILSAKADGQDISQVDRQAQGQFKLSDGTIIDRAEAKTRFGQDRSELLIPQDEAAKKANADYAKEPSSRLQENGSEQPTTSNQSELKDVESTAKALESIDEKDFDKLSPTQKVTLYNEHGITKEDGSPITENDIENNPLQYSYDFSASSDSGKWNSANSELQVLVQANRKAKAYYELLIGDDIDGSNTFKSIVDYINNNTDAKIEYTDRMRRADETMTAKERQDAVDSYNKSSEDVKSKGADLEKDILNENGLVDEKEYSPSELIKRFPLTGVQKIIWDIINPIVEKLDIKVKFSSSRIGIGYDGLQNPMTGETLIKPSTLKRGRFQEVLVHEIVHALTTKIISRVNTGVETGLSSRQVNAVKGLMKLYKSIKDDNNLQNKYPVKDVFEFIAHLTNDTFVKELQSKDKNFIQKVVDFISDILGISDANELAKKYLKDIIHDGAFLEKEGITVVKSDYASNVKGAEGLSPKQRLLEAIKNGSKNIANKYHSDKNSTISKSIEFLLSKEQNKAELKALEQQPTPQDNSNIDPITILENEKQSKIDKINKSSLGEVAKQAQIKRVESEYYKLIEDAKTKNEPINGSPLATNNTKSTNEDGTNVEQKVGNNAITNNNLENGKGNETIEAEGQKDVLNETVGADKTAPTSFLNELTGNPDAVTVSGLTEGARQKQIEKRVKELTLTDAEKAENEVMSLVDRFNNLQNGRLGKGKTEGVQLLNKIRLLAKANKFIAEGGGSSQKITVKKRLANGKIGNITRKQKDTGRRSIVPNGKTFNERTEGFQREFMRLMDLNIPFDFRNPDASAFPESQINSALDDIYNGIPSENAEYVLNHVQQAIETGIIDYGSKSQGFKAIKIEDAIAEIEDAIKEDIFKNMSDEEIIAMYENELEQLQLEADEIDRFEIEQENLINQEYEQLNNSGEVQDTIPESQEISNEENKNIPDKTGSQAKTTQKEQVAEQPKAEQESKEDVPNKKVSRKIRDEKAKKEIDDAWEDFMGDSGLLTSGGLDPKKLEAGTKLISLYIKQGVYKFSDIAQDAYAKFGSKLADIMDELKAVYSAYYNTTSDEIASQMDSNVRGVYYEKIVGEVEVAEIPKEVFTQAIQDRIENGDKLNIIQLRKTANDVGYKFTSDTELQEHTEVAIINIAKGITQENISQQEKFDKIVSLYEAQPTISMRSADRIENQQYSTPIPMSFVAGEFVNEITPKTILEPSAGNGMMVFNTNHSNVIANEKDKVRLSNLQNKGFKLVTNHDALLPFNIGKVDAVVMNPPFGKAEQKLYGDAYKVSGLDPQMVINALDSMKDDGRASIVIGGHNEYESNGALKKDKAFLNYLYNYYNVSDIVNVAGDLYSKQGTSFPTRMIFINGRRTDTSVRRFAPLGTETNSAVVKTFDELYNRVKSIQNETISSPTVSDNNIDAGQQPDNNANGTDFKKGSRKVNTTVRNGRGKADSDIGGLFGNEQRNDGGGVTRSDNGIQPNNTSPISNQGQTNVPSVEPPRAVRRENPILIPGRVIGTPRTIDESKEKTEYVPQSNSGKIGSVLPTNMASALESILSQFGDIDGYVMDRLQYPNKEALYQALAAEQVDSVALGIYQIENGNALIIGDQTGVGKGRQAAALIRYGVLNGYKPIFLTEKPHLFSDIYRDMRDIGSGQMNPFIINDKSADSDPSMTDEAGAVIYKPLSSTSKKPIYAKGEIPNGYDYVAVTYSQLSGSIDKASAKKEFFASIASNNIIIADESHNAGGSGNTGQFLQNIVPTTKGMVFLSGTFAKRPDNMPIYALKTGMSEANMSSSEMVEAIQKGGVPLQEIMSKGLVDLGQMVRRERDFTGVNIDWETLNDSKESHTKTFNAVIDIFNDLIHFQRDHITPIVEQLNDMMKAEHGVAEKTKGTSDLGISNTPFASKTFNLVRQLLLSLKAEDVARETIGELRAGRKPVIAIANTMESFLKDMNIQDGDVLGNVDYSLTLKKGLDGLFRYTERDFAGNPAYKYLSVNDLSEEGKTIYNDLVSKIKQASSGITISPIDVIKKRIKEAGYKVGEMTGRDIELDIQDNGGAIVSKRTDKNKKKLARDFNAGDIDVLIINQSGSTGISLHASEKFNDKRQRVMLSAQTQLDVNTEIQLRGRIDRTGQLVRGAYRYIISPIPAEQRLIMMFKAKLKSLDANTTSSQKSKTNEIEVVDFLNKYGDEIVTEYLKENRNINDKLLDPLGLDSMSDEGIDELEKVDGASNKVSGRVALLNVAEQESFYNEVSERYTSHLKYLEDNNANDLEIKVLPLEAQVNDKKVIVAGANSGNPFSENSWLETAEVNVLRKPMTQAEIKAEMATYMEGKDNQGYKTDNISKIEQYFDQQITTEADKITEDYNRKEKRISDIARNEAIKAGVDVEQSVKAAIDRLNEARDLRIQMSNTKRNNIKSNVTRVINGLNTGKSYLVPNSVNIGTDTTYSDGVFIGLKMKAKLTPSNITAVFATLDGRRKVEVPLSKTQYLNAVIGQSNLGYSQVNLENWDTKTSNKTRRTAHILTGNILQAFAVNKGGQLVTFTTKDGGLRQGILMPENYNPEKQKTRVQIVAGLGKLESGISLLDTSREIEVIPIRGDYELRVPLSRKQGGKYFLDDKLRDLVRNRAFNQLSNRMVAEVSSNRISDVLQYLSVHHNTSIEIDSKELEDNTAKYQKSQEQQKTVAKQVLDTVLGKLKIAFPNVQVEGYNPDQLGDILGARLSKKDDYNGISRKDAAEIQNEKALELVNKLQDKGYSPTYPSTSTTNFGVSTYISFISDDGKVRKFRISDHDTGYSRAMSEYHYGLNSNLDNLIIDVEKDIKRDKEIALERSKQFEADANRTKLANEKWERIKDRFNGLTFKKNNRTYADLEKFSENKDRTNIYQKKDGNAFSYEWTEPIEKAYEVVLKPSREYIEAYNENEGSVQFFKKPDGTIYGFFKDGKIYLNENEVNVNTPIHEYGHLFAEVIKRENPALHKEIINVVKRDKALMDKVRNDANYSYLTTEDGIADEVLAKAIGDAGEQKFLSTNDVSGIKKTIRQRIIDLVNRAWKSIKNIFAKSNEDIRNWSVEKLQYSTLAEVTNTMASQLLAGEKISDISSEDLAGGQSKFSVQPKETAFEDYEQALVNYQQDNSFDNELALIDAYETAVNTDKNKASGLEVPEGLKETTKEIFDSVSNANVPPGTPPPPNDNAQGGDTIINNITHSATGSLRESLGLPEYDKKIVTDDELNKLADDYLYKNSDVLGLIMELENNNRLPNEVEQVVIGKYLDKLNEEFTDTPTNELLSKIERATNALDKIGTMLGRGLRNRRTDLYDTNQLSYWMMEQKRASQVGVLEQEQLSKVTEEFEKINKAKAALEAKIKKLESELYEKEATKNIRTTKADSRKTHDDFVAERSNIIDSIRKKLRDARGNINSTPVPYLNEILAITPDVLKLAKSFASEGIMKLADVIDNIHEMIKDDSTNITKQDIQDIIGGKYNKTQKTKSEIKSQMREWKTEASLVQRLQDLEEGIVPEKLEDRTKRNQEIHELRKRIKENNLSRLDVYKKKLQSYINGLEQELSSGDFTNAKKQEIVLDAEALRLKDEYIRLKRERAIRLMREEYNNRSKREKATDKFLEVINVPRTIMASMDFSAPLRQAAVVTISHPKTALAAAKEMFLQAFSQKRFDRWFNDVKESEFHPYIQESGLFIADPHDIRLSVKEEQFMNNLAEKIPFFGKLIKGSERAYVLYLNKMRLDLFIRGLSILQNDTNSTMDLESEMKALANYINNATGRGKMPDKIETAAPILNSVFFSPRLIASRINLLTNLVNPMYYAKTPPAVRNMFIKDMAIFIGFNTALLALLKFMFECEDDCTDCDNCIRVETDPRSTDFAKLRIGDTRYDIWGGFQQYVRLIAQIGSGNRKSASTGQVHSLDGEGMFGQDRTDVLGTFVRGKLAPIPGSIYDYAKGTNIVGEEVTLQSLAKRNLIPLIATDIKSAWSEQGAVSLLTVGLPASFGIGVNTFETRKTKYSPKVYAISDLSGVGDKTAQKLIDKGVDRDKLNKMSVSQLMSLRDSKGDKIFNQKSAFAVRNGIDGITDGENRVKDMVLEDSEQRILTGLGYSGIDKDNAYEAIKQVRKLRSNSDDKDSRKNYDNVIKELEKYK